MRLLFLSLFGSDMFIIFIFFSCIPLAIWGYRAGDKRKIGSTWGMLLGLFLNFIGIMIVYCSHDAEKPLSFKVELMADQLKKFKDLLDSGAITETEYNIQKAKILNS